MARHWAVLIVLAAVLTSISTGTAGAQGADALAELNAQVEKLYQDGKYAEGEVIAKRSLALAESLFGPDHTEVGVSLGNLGELWRAQGRYAEAEPMFKRALAIHEKAHGPDHTEVGASLNSLASLHQAQGRYGEAEPLFRRALAIHEKALGPDHTEVAASLNNLASLYWVQGRYAEAEQLYVRALAIREKAFGPDHPDVATSLNNLSQLYRVQGRYAEAEQLYVRALAIREKLLGADHPDVSVSLNGLAVLFHGQGRYEEAESLFRRALAIREKAFGPDHPDVATSLNNLSQLYRAQGRNAEAEPLLDRALAIREKALGPDHTDVATSLNNLATLYWDQARYAEAEPLLKRTVSIFEKALGPDHIDVGTALNNVAFLYRVQSRYSEAEPLLERALAIREKALGPDHPDVGSSLNNLAQLYQFQNRFGESEQLYKRGLAVREKALGPDHADVGASLNNLADLYRAQGRYAEAEPLAKRTISIFEKVLGPDHADVGTSLNNLASLYRAQERYVEAEPLFKRSLAIREKALGPDHPQVGYSLNNLAEMYLVQGDLTQAADFWRRSTGGIIMRARRGGNDVGQAVAGKGRTEAEQLRWQFWGLVKVTYRLASAATNPDPSLTQEMFQTAQWAQASEAAASLSQMAARGAKGNPELANIVRERQDLVAEWQGRDVARSAAFSQPPDKRNRAAEAVNLARLAAIDARLAEIDSRLKSEFPDYAALSRPEPLSIGEVQKDLHDDEVLVFILDTPEGGPMPEETFIWVVTNTGVRWVRSEFGTRALAREVFALRCGLDYDGAWGATGSRCAELLNLAYTESDRRAGKPLPFDVGRAHSLYKALFGQVEDLIKGKHLLVVPSGPLTQLPFQVLVTAPRKQQPARAGDYRKIAWLAHSNSVTVLPAVPSLKALRRDAKASRATKPFLGFGNPLLDGPNGLYASLKQAALEKQSCRGTRPIRVAESRGRGGAKPFALRSGIASVAQLRQAAPLPETADEVCDVAKATGASETDIFLGGRASEREVKQLSQAGSLRDYRIVHFATHGALAGEVSGSAEPGLLLTPPENGTEIDDGYLSASEIAGLKMDADWVILSACNTAAGEAQDAEALSGLARAFFYAGARALLVSHWYVDSVATVALIKGAFAELKANPKLGRADALRRSMLALIDKGGDRQAHPSAWAPFVVVGEGRGAK